MEAFGTFASWQGKKILRATVIFSHPFENRTVIMLVTVVLSLPDKVFQYWLSNVKMYWIACQSLYYSGFNTYWHISHMKAKNRSNPHSHHQPLLLSHLPSPLLSPLSQHIPLLLSPPYPLRIHTAQLSHAAKQNVHFVHILTRCDTRMLVEKHTWRWGVTVFFRCHIFKHVICCSAICVSVVTLGCKWELSVEYIVRTHTHMHTYAHSELQQQRIPPFSLVTAAECV